MKVSRPDRLMEDKHFKKWEKCRSMGALRFILMFDLAWGSSVVILHYLIGFVANAFFWPDSPGTPFSSGDLLNRFGAALIGGLIWSSVMWLVFESRFRRENDRRNASESGRYTLNI